MYCVPVFFLLTASLRLNGATAERTFNNIEVTVYNDQLEVANKKIFSDDLLEGLQLGATNYDAIQIGEYVDTTAKDLDKIIGNTGSLSVLRKDSLTRLNISSLTITYTDLEHIEPGTFKDVIRLNELTIQWTALKDIKRGTFNGLPILVLQMNSNEIEIVEPESFEGMSKLMVCRLANNKLSHITEKFLSNLPQLQLVDLSWNNIERIENGAFGNLPQLKVLFLERNRIKQVDDNFLRNLPNLIQLNLGYNNIKEFHSDYVGGSKKLRELYINNNEITDISPDSLSDIHRLEILDLSCNNIMTIKNGTFSNLNIIELDLSNNKIQNIEKEALGNLLKLKILNLYHNNISELDDVIRSRLPPDTSINFTTY